MNRVVIVLTLVAAGCVHTVGQPLDLNRVAELQPGVSTLGDAKERFGEPAMAMNNPQRPGTCYSWTYVSAGAFSQTDVRQVHLCFDEQGKYAPGPQAIPVKLVQ